VELRVELAAEPGRSPEWKYELGIQQPRGKREPTVAFERVWKAGELLLNRPDKSDQDDPERRSETHLEQINSNQKFRAVAQFFRTASYLHLVPQLVRHPEAFSGPGLADDPFGGSFIERVMRAPEKTRRARLGRIQKALKVAVPQFSELSAVKDEAGIGHLEALYEHWRPDGARQREDQFSDGTLRLIALLWSVLEGESLLLLEEPELSLNAGIVRRLPAIIYRLQRKQSRQVLVSTHSADLLDDKGIGGEEVLLLQPGKEGTEVRVASAICSIRTLLDSGFSAAEAVLPAAAPEAANQLELDLLA
jgi:predicted ATPase